MEMLGTASDILDNIAKTVDTDINVVSNMQVLRTPSDFLDTITKTVDAYKETKAEVEKYFANSPFLPDDLLSPFQDASMSDDENVRSKRVLYQWSNPIDQYPPHLNLIPPGQITTPLSIFDPVRLLQVQASLLPGEVEFFHGLGSAANLTMSVLEKRNSELHEEAIAQKKEDIYAANNVGLRTDWYTDAQFAQQHFTGVNPTGLKKASSFWIEAFRTAARGQNNTASEQLISSAEPDSLYVVDNSDYRSMLGKASDATLVSSGGPLSSDQPRYVCASVILFTLSSEGKLHPVAIVLDYRGSIAPSTSVTIFNRRLTPDAKGVDEASDWPWRYAKMCSHASDWHRHELAVHLVYTHLVEEALIVAAQRNFPDSHIIFQLLQPHWKKTLSLNALARLFLVPIIINNIAGLKLPDILAFCKSEYHRFDFEANYPLNDLNARGFPVQDLDDKKYHNYVYGRDIAKSWNVLRKFVSEILRGQYKGGDADVRKDKFIAGFCAEMQSAHGGQLASFPAIKTLDSLIEVVTMCIHIAAPQHTAVNYLQQFYLSFVPNRPASLAAPLPRSLEQLARFTERDVIASLPVADQKDWLLMAEVPYLLSSEVEPENNIIAYAEQAAQSSNPLIAKAGQAFNHDIQELTKTFHEYSDAMDDQVTKYHVLDPEVMATSILI